MEHKTVFISYRRTASKHLGRAIYQDLKMNGYDCFFDVESIDSGQFNQIILNQIAARAHFVLIISDGSLVRCQNAGDWVLREIQEAVRLGRNIVPLIEEGANFDREMGYLPADLQTLLRAQNALRIPHDFFEEAMAKLRNRYLKQPIVGAIVPTPTLEQPIVRQLSRYTAELVVDVRGRGNYTRIGDALQAAPAGARITVRQGTYLESKLTLSKTVTLEGEGGRDRVIVQSDAGSCLIMNTGEAWVSGIGFRCTAKFEQVNCFGIDIPTGRLTLSDCSVTSSSNACVGIHTPAAQPYLVECVLHDGRQSGVFVYESGAGVIEDCQIYGNALAGIQIRTGGNPTVRRCTLRDGKQTGVFVNDNGAGVIEDCQIYGNAYSGIEIKTGGNPTVRACTITKNGYQAVYAHDNARGTVERCDLRGNTKGAWNIDATSQVVQRDNQA
ncbi:MAG: right-handed parallel beta-helix repeat-containing protein [Anaerolineae bacterium]|nr:right-handed parallel beta-helix repeat-containing protein [Anaerolineae bacterium]